MLNAIFLARPRHRMANDFSNSLEESRLGTMLFIHFSDLVTSREELWGKCWTQICTKSLLLLLGVD